MNTLNLDTLHGLLEHPETLQDKKAMHTKMRALGAAYVLLQTRGWSDISTNRIAKMVGISQPSFYAHYKNLDACLEDFVEVLISPGVEFVAQWQDSLPDQSDDMASWLAHHSTLVERAGQFGLFMNLFFEHRRATHLLGTKLRQLEDRVLAHHREHRRVMIEIGGLDPDFMAPQVEVYAHGLSAITFGLLEQYHHERLSQKMCAKLLTSQALALSAHIFRGQMQV